MPIDPIVPYLHLFSVTVIFVGPLALVKSAFRINPLLPEGTISIFGNGHMAIPAGL